MKVILRPALSQNQVRHVLSRVEKTYASEIGFAFSLDEKAAATVAAQTVWGVIKETYGGGDIGHICCLKSLRRVGEYWYSLDKDIGIARLQYLFIASKWRRQGYGTAAITAIHATLLEQGSRCVGLNVFAANVGALALYRACGYMVGSHEMVCSLQSSAPQPDY